jgi:O-acetylhomoserine (thiol)-lyase
VKNKQRKWHTNLIHNNDETKNSGATNTPLILSTAFAHNSAAEISSVFTGRKPGFIYSRINNPTVQKFEQSICNLEDGIGALACASGMAAISCALLAFVEQGKTILSSSSLFGGTYSLLEKTFKRFGIKVCYFDPTQPAEIEDLVDESVGVIFTETIGNPKIDVAFIEQIAEVAHSNHLPLIVDNTITTPVLFSAKEHGVDFVVYSTSKYFDGQGRVIGGCIVDLGTSNWDISRFDHLTGYKLQFGSEGPLRFMRMELMSSLGSCMSPYNAATHLSGLETLAMRMERHCTNAQALASFLDQHKKVKHVRYPGLEDHPQHNIATKLFNGQFGGMLSIELDSLSSTNKLINNLQLTKNLANIGDAKSLVIHPSSTIYFGLLPEEQERIGVNERLVRISVGLEDGEDILEDFEHALSKI